MAKPANEHKRALEVWIWVTRIVCAIIILIALGLFVVGLPAQFEILRGDPNGLEFEQNEQGETVLTPALGAVADTAGILSGDVLLSINNTHLAAGTGLDEVVKLYEKAAGEQLNIQVRHADGTEQSITLIPPATYQGELTKLHLSPLFLSIYRLVFHVIFVAGFALVAFLLFRFKSTDPFTLLVALALVAFAVRSVPEMYLVSRIYTWTRFPAILVGLLGVVLPVWVLCMFPNGKFVPGWLPWMASLATLWYAAFFLPARFNPDRLPGVVLTAAAMVFYGIGILAQLYRYIWISNLHERQQTKWAVLGFAGAFMFSYLLLIPIGNLAFFEQTVSGTIWYIFINRPLFFLGLLLVPLTMGLSMVRYKLWDADVVINRAVIYATLLGLMGLLWNAGIALLDKILEDFLTARSEVLSVALSGAGVAALFVPVKTRLEKWINRRLYPDKVDFEAALVELRPDVLDGIAMPDLFHALVTTVPALLQCKYAALYDMRDGKPSLLETTGLPAVMETALELPPKSSQQLCKGSLLQQPDDKRFPLLVPLSVPRGKLCDLIGLLALGPRLEGRGFSRDHLADLSALGARAGTAIHIVELNDKKELSLRKQLRT